MAVLGCLAKLKRGLGLPFGVYFLHDFSVKILCTSLPMARVSKLHLFPPQYIKQNMLCSYNMKIENLRLITQKRPLK